MDNKGALAKLDNTAALAELASGTLSKEIAARYGVTPYAVRKRLSKDNPSEYQSALASQSESFVEDALFEVINVPLDQVAIAHARALG